MPRKLTPEKVLRYHKGRRSQATVKKYYLQWRAEQDPPIPNRCDNPECTFFSEPLVWNGEELKLVLDHIEGVRGDNRPENLRLLCPNCNSQQKTHGGGNKDRVNESEGGYGIKSDDGKWHYTMPVEPGHIKVTGGEVEMTKKPKE